MHGGIRPPGSPGLGSCRPSVEGTAEYEVGGGKRVRVTQSPHGDVLHGPRPDAGQGRERGSHLGAVRGRVEVDPPRRAVFTWGWQGNEHVPPGSTTVEVDLIPDGTGTVVRFAHHGLPGGPSDPHVRGWTHYLGRLEIAGRGGDPGRDSFLDEHA